MKKILYITIPILILSLTIIFFQINSKNKIEVDKNNTIDQINVSDEKVNLYFFWGEGCNICKQQFTFFEKNYNKYKDKVNIYSFEVWNNKDNHELMNDMANYLNDTVKGVPYTVIGKDSFKGYNQNIGKKILEAIDNNIKNDFDVYEEINKK